MDADKRYMQLALGLAAEAAKEGEVPVGAVVVSDGRIVAKAYNLTERLHDATAHAEMLALTSASEALGAKHLTSCTLYVTLEPCPMCAAALGLAHVARLVYGAPDPKRGYQHLAPSVLHPRTEVTTGLMADECSAQLLAFFRQRR